MSRAMPSPNIIFESTTAGSVNTLVRAEADLSVSHRLDRRSSEHILERLQKALIKVAHLLEHDPVYAPIFTRLEREIELEYARRQDDVLTRARAVIRQNEIGRSKAVTC